MSSAPFTDLAEYVALPRLTGIALGPDGRRLVAAVQHLDDKGARYATALWQIPLGDDGAPEQLTRSEKGENSPVFRPDGALLFTSSRPDPASDDDDAALWALPAAGEPVVLARRAGGLSGPVVARESGHVLVAGSRLAWTGVDGDDAARRTERDERKVTAILHTGMPIRYWDHDLGDTSPRLLLLAPDAEELVDLAPDATTELVNAAYSISADGSTVATSWRVRAPRGRETWAVAVIDVASGERTVLEPPPGHRYGSPVVSPDGRHLAVSQERIASFDVSVHEWLAVLPVTGGDPVALDVGDLWPGEWVWSPDSSVLHVSGDLHGRGGVVTVDPGTGAVVRSLATDAVYSSLQVSPDGATIYAVRSAVDSVPTPVRLATGGGDHAPELLATPAPTPELPGTVTELDVPLADGGSVHTWLFLPPAGGEPAPVMQWIHGGPFGSYNAWSWRWNPWLAVAQGWAVILPDPAMSTGYGRQIVDRAWPYRADVVWREVETVLDAVLERPDVDASRTALLGASFGGFMVNWIAGHTDRFAAIVSHAGLWALDQQHATTDAAHYKTEVFGTLAEHPDWYARYSPHHTVDRIVTPMLIVHGTRDYRVPVSEALRLWWDLVSRWDGPAADLPHRFLNFTGENHWVLSPANAEIWNDAVLSFCAQHVLGRPPWRPSIGM